MSMVGSFVIYNGGKEAYYGCDAPEDLVKGKRYKVVAEEIKPYQTNLTLHGVNGKFNSVWFDKDNDDENMKKVWFAKAITYNNIEMFLGKPMRLIRLHDGGPSELVTTSYVESIDKVYGNVYKIETANSVYITDVKKRIEG